MACPTFDVGAVEHCIEHALHDFSGANRLVVGFSGGLDSTVLLRLAAQYAFQNKLPLVALHVHHGLSPNADQWVEHCRQIAREFSIVCIVEHVCVASGAGSLEAKARAVRYQAFEEHLQSGDVLLLGHHADDQIETVLMRILKGVDAALLSGIPRARALNEATVLRPLLEASRKQLEAYAVSNKLRWIDDESNDDLNIKRNDLRQRVLPKLRDKQSDIDEHLLELSIKQEKLNRSLSELYLQLSPCVTDNVASGNGLRIDRLAELSHEAQAVLVRQWISHQGAPQPSDKIFERIWSEVIPARPDSNPMLNWGATKLRRYGYWLFLDSEKPRADFSEYRIQLADQSILHGGLQFSLSPDGASVIEGLVVALPPMKDVCVKGFSLFASREKLLGKTKKEWCRELGIAPWVQAQIFVVEVRGDVVAMIDAISLVVLAEGEEGVLPFQNAMSLVVKRV